MSHAISRASQPLYFLKTPMRECQRPSFLQFGGRKQKCIIKNTISVLLAIITSNFLPKSVYASSLFGSTPINGKGCDHSHMGVLPDSLKIRETHAMPLVSMPAHLINSTDITGIRRLVRGNLPVGMGESPGWYGGISELVWGLVWGESPGWYGGWYGGISGLVWGLVWGESPGWYGGWYRGISGLVWGLVWGNLRVGMGVGMGESPGWYGGGNLWVGIGVGMGESLD